MYEHNIQFSLSFMNLLFTTRAILAALEIIDDKIGKLYFLLNNVQHNITYILHTYYIHITCTTYISNKLGISSNFDLLKNKS